MPQLMMWEFLNVWQHLMVKKSNPDLQGSDTIDQELNQQLYTGNLENLGAIINDVTRIWSFQTQVPTSHITQFYTLPRGTFINVVTHQGGRGFTFLLQIVTGHHTKV